MTTIVLGRTGLEVSRIAFGTWQLGGEWGGFDESAAIDAIRRARDLGITLFDTAQAYGFGASEQILGRALRPELTRDRDSVVIATKGASGRPSATPRRPSSATGPRRACATSASTSSTSTRSTGPTRACTPRRPPARCRRWSTRGRSASSASPTTTSRTADVELSPEALARIDEIAAGAEQIGGATPEGVA